MSTMDISQFNCPTTTVEKNRLFYNQYHYSGKFYLSELGVIRGLNADRIDDIVAYRNQSRRYKTYSSLTRELISDKNVEFLKIVCDLLSQYKDQIKFVVSYNRGHVYTNNLEILKKIKELEFIYSFSIQQVDVTSASDSIALINPKWSYRTYFRNITLSDHQRDTLIQYLDSRENISLSPGLKSWCTDPKNRWWDRLLQSYFFVDHNDSGEIVFLNMVIPRITNKTFRLVAK